MDTVECEAETVDTVEDIRKFVLEEKQLPRSRWFFLEEYHIYVYLRSSIHTKYIFQEPGFKPNVTVANVAVMEPYRMQGNYSKFLAFIESLGYPVLIENVLDPDQYELYLRRGYTHSPLSYCCFEKLPK